MKTASKQLIINIIYLTKKHLRLRLKENTFAKKEKQHFLNLAILVFVSKELFVTRYCWLADIDPTLDQH